MTSPPPNAGANVDMVLAERVARQITAIHATSETQRTHAVGALVLSAFFGGQREVHARYGRGFRHPTLKEVARRLGRSDASLHATVVISERLHILPEAVGGALTIAHLRALCTAPEAQQLELGRAAVNQGWTSRRLHREARALTPRPERGPGRPPKPADLVHLDAVVRRLTLAARETPSAAGQARLDEAARLIAQLRERVAA